MAMVPNTVGEAVDILSTYPREMLIRFFDENEGYMWTFSFNKERVDYLDKDTPFEILTLNLFESKEPY